MLVNTVMAHIRVIPLLNGFDSVTGSADNRCTGMTPVDSDTSVSKSVLHLNLEFRHCETPFVRVDVDSDCLR